MSRVLVFSHEFPPYLGGVGTVGAQLARFLVGRGFEVDVVTRAQAGRLDIPGVTFHDVVVTPKLWFRSYKRALDAIGLEQFDHIILNEAAPTIVAGKYFDRATLERSLVLLHGLEVERIYHSSLANLARRLAGFASAHRRAVSLAGGVFAASDDMRQKFLDAVGNISAKPIGIVYCGADNKIFNLMDSAYRDERGLDVGDVIMVTASRIDEFKGFDDKLDIFERASREIESLKWIICGDGPALANLQREVTARGLDSRIIFEGQCTRQRLCYIYNACDIFWLLSKYREAFPLVYIEAQLSGLPTIGRNLGGVREAIIPGTTGWLIENAPECLDILHSHLAAPTMSRRQVAKAAQRFSSEETLETLLPLLDEPGTAAR